MSFNTDFNDDFKLVDSGKVVGDLLNDDVAIVICTKPPNIGAETCIVKYELADFLEDEPPFIEVCFLDSSEDAYYFTENLQQKVYMIDGVYVVRGDKNES